MAETVRILRPLTFSQSKQTYWIEWWDNGPGTTLSLGLLTPEGLVAIGKPLEISSGDSATTKDRELYLNLAGRMISEQQLIGSFSQQSTSKPLLDPEHLDSQWKDPNGWSTRSVSASKGKLEATIISEKPLTAIKSTLNENGVHTATVSGSLLHLRHNSYLILIDGDRGKLGTAHLFVSLYREQESLRFVFSRNLLEVENM